MGIEEEEIDVLQSSVYGDVDDIVICWVGDKNIDGAAWLTR